jgi:hypothetical protein
VLNFTIWKKEGIKTILDLHGDRDRNRMGRTVREGISGYGIR